MRTLQDAVRDALLNEWDPIGVKTFEHAQDEYDAYVDEVCQLLTRTRSLDDVFAYLWQLETEHIGLSGNETKTRRFADRLLKLAAECLNDGVWVFCGANSRLPSGVFKELTSAEEWIERNQLTGILTLYPLDTGLYDLALARGWFKPKPQYPSQTSPEFKGRFTCAYLPHHHYENGKREA